MAWPSDGSYTAWSTCCKATTQASKITAVNSWYFLDLSLLPAAFWSSVRSDGADIRCTEDDGETAIYHRLIFIDTSISKGLIAIAQPHGSSGATVDIESRVYSGNAGASTTSNTAAFPSTLEGLWMLQEAPTSSAAVLDYTGNGRNSEAIGGSMTSGDLLTRSDGPHSSLMCVDFDSNDYVRVPSTIFDDCETAGAYTFFAWYKPSNDVSDYGIFGSAGSQLAVRFTTGGTWYTLEALQRNSANSAFFTSTGTADNMAANAWHLIHAVYNGSTLKTYVNGVQTGTVAATSLRSATLNFYIGFDNTTYSRGRFAEVGMYSSALSADQIGTIYANETDAGFWVTEEISGVTDVIAAGDIVFDGVVFDGTSNIQAGASGDIVFDGLVLDGTANVVAGAAGDIVFDGLVLDGTANVLAGAAGDIVFDGLVLDGTANVVAGAAGDIVFDGLVLDGTAHVDATGAGAIVFDGLVLDGAATVAGAPAADVVAAGDIVFDGINFSGLALTAPTGAISCDALAWFLSGADADGQSQRDQGLSLGGYRSGTPLRVMTWKTREPMVGLEILAVGGANGRGAGVLTAVTEDSVSWTPPGGSTLPDGSTPPAPPQAGGNAVTLALGDEATLYGFGGAGWIRVRRRSALPLQGSHTVQCLDLMNNAIGFGNVESADAIAGATYYRAVIGRNRLTEPIHGIRIYLDADASAGLALAYEDISGGSIQSIANETTAPVGLTWNTGTTAGTGLNVGGLLPGHAIGLWIRRTIGADSDPSPDVLNLIHIEMDDGANTYTDALRGRYRIAREDWETYGLWYAQDGLPDLDGPPDVLFSSVPFTTSLGLAVSHVYNALVRWRNKWGLWSPNVELEPLVMDGDGELDFTPPSAPNTVVISQTADNEAIVGARYEPAFDDDIRAEIFVLWMTTDGAAPDPSDPPTAYQQMGRRSGIEIFKYTDTVELLDGTPVEALVRTRRLAVGAGTSFSPDTTQLPASGAGTIVVAEELAGWPSTGYAKVLTFSGVLQEVFEYSSLVVGSGISTFTVGSGGRGLWGTTAAATSTNTVIYPVVAVDSMNTETTTGEMDGLAPARPWGELLVGDQYAIEQTPIAGPDGVTEEYIDLGDNIYLLLGAGWCELWMDADLVWKVFQDGNNGTANRLYIPSEWDLVAASVSGAGSGVFEAASATSLYVCAGGVRKMHIDSSAMTITALEFSALGGLPEVAPQETTWEQYAGSLLQVWDPARSDYRPYGRMGADGRFTSAWDVDNSLSQAEVVAI